MFYSHHDSKRHIFNCATLIFWLHNKKGKASPMTSLNGEAEFIYSSQKILIQYNNISSWNPLFWFYYLWFLPCTTSLCRRWNFLKARRWLKSPTSRIKIKLIPSSINSSPTWWAIPTLKLKSTITWMLSTTELYKSVSFTIS